MGGLVPSRLRENGRERGGGRKKKERAGPERGALCCSPPHRISQSNIHLGCRPPAPRTLSKTNLPLRFYRPSLLQSPPPPHLPSFIIQRFRSRADLQTCEPPFWVSRGNKLKGESRVYVWRMQMLPYGAGEVAEWCESTRSGLRSRHVSTTYGRL